MPTPTYFLQQCPTCGRRLHVSVRYLGRQVKCQHCRAVFRASNHTHSGDPTGDTAAALLDRVEQLLALSEQRTVRLAP